MFKQFRGAVLGLILCVLFPTNSFATPFQFSVIQPANNSASTLAQLLFTVNVTQGNGGRVLFDFDNDSSIASFIAQIYFDDHVMGLLSSGQVQAASGTVSFHFGTAPPGPNNLPGGNNVGFTATSALNAKADNPAPVNGVNSGESITLSYLGSFNNVIAALVSGDLRIGLHVQGICGELSDSFVNTPVPEPTTMTLLGFGLLGLGARRKLKKA